MNLFFAAIFAASALAATILSFARYTDVAPFSTIAAAVAVIALLFTAIAFLMRHRVARLSQTMSGPRHPPNHTERATAFWTWMTRLSIIVGIIAGLFSIGRDLFTPL